MPPVVRALASLKLTTALLVVIAVVLSIGTILESVRGTEAASLTLTVLAPENVGLATSEQPAEIRKASLAALTEYENETIGTRVLRGFKPGERALSF